MARLVRSIILLGWMMFFGSNGVRANPLATTGDKHQEEADWAIAREDGSRGDNGWSWNAASGWQLRDRRRDAPEADHPAAKAAASSRPYARDGVRIHVRRQAEEKEENQEETTAFLSGEEHDALAKDRDYLNGLVAASAAKTRQQACNIAFAKTHKTASTTLAMILVRYGRRHDMKLADFGGNHVSMIPLREAVQQTHKSGERVDVMHYHYSDSGNFNGRWVDAKFMYKQIMREGERINYITVVRNHREHFLSYYYYFVQPDVQLSVIHFFGSNQKGLDFHRKRLINPMCAEFGIHSGEELDHFIETELPDFRLVILTEAFDEGLMVLRRLMGWDMIDMTYSRMMETKEGARRWDGKSLKNVPDFDKLPVSVQDHIDANTDLDRRLYEAAVELYNDRKAVAAIEVKAELEEFEKLQALMSLYLQRNTSSEAIKWYSRGVQPYLGGPAFHPF